MENCNTNITITTTEEICGGKYTSSSCVSIPNNITYLDISAGDSQTEVNAALVTALMYKDEQIASLPIQDGSETKIVAGDNVTVTGEGTIATPYVVNSTAAASSGTYTPTITNVTNVSGISPQLSRYTIIGKIVTVNVGFDFSAITANSFSQITITLPVNRSTSHSSNIGSGAVQPLFQGVIPAIVQTDNVSFARCSFNTGSLGSYIGYITFTYSTN